MTATVFIDGEAGTTGLQIHARLAGRQDLAIASIDPSLRKDIGARRQHLNTADVVILCLPDEAARAAVALIENPVVKVIDASTAHRTSAAWTYGFPELRAGHRAAIRASGRVSNPGCYPTGFLALVAPLVREQLLPADWPITVNAVSGYSGGGRSMIAEFEDPNSADFTTTAFRPYAAGLKHKHVPEMQKHSGLALRPLFAPSVGRYAQGMIVQVPLQLGAMPDRPKVADLHAALGRAYADERFVEVVPLDETQSIDTLNPEALNGTNRLRLYVFGDDAFGQANLVAVLDNLGKGASGAAVQTLNLMLGLEEATGL